VLSTLDNLQLRIRRTREQLNLLLCVSNAVHSVVCALNQSTSATIQLRTPEQTYMQPQNRTHDIAHPRMQPIPIPQVDRRHTDPFPPLLAPIILPNLFKPILPNIRRTLLAKPNLDQKRQKLISRDKLGPSILGPKRIFDKRLQTL
jgi:hypothetical protein